MISLFWRVDVRFFSQIIDSKSGLAKIDQLLSTQDMTRTKAKVSFLSISTLTPSAFSRQVPNHTRASTSLHQPTGHTSVRLGVVRRARRDGERLLGAARVHGCDDGESNHAIDVYEVGYCFVFKLCRPHATKGNISFECSTGLVGTMRSVIMGKNSAT